MSGVASTSETAETEVMRLRDELMVTRQRAREELQRARQETFDGLCMAIEMHDSSTGEHVSRMGRIAAFVGDRLGLDADRVEMLRAAAPMHDVGKIGTPTAILGKPGPLTPGERKSVEVHARAGYEIFARFRSELARVAGTIALTHHEHFDGNGYPQGLAGEEIPLEGRITAVADVFDALLSDRSYRPAMSVEEAVTTMSGERGTHFDPRIIDVLLDHVEEALEVRGEGGYQMIDSTGIPVGKGL